MAGSTEIFTARLTLQALTSVQLRSYLSDGIDFQRKLGAASRVILTPILKRAIEMKLEKIPSSDPDDWPWITYWLIRVPPKKFGAGLIGYKGPPDSNGEVEIGYGIDPSYANQGYTTEALLEMVNWAFTNSYCLRILAPKTLRSNPASNRVLQKAGFQIYAEDQLSISWHLEKPSREKS